MFLEIVCTVIAVALVVLVVLAVPVLVQVRRTARNLELTLEALNQGLPGVLRNLEEITANIKTASCTVGREVDELASAIARVRQVLGIGEGGCLVSGAGRVFRTLRTISAAAKGASVFFEVFRSRR